MTEKPLPALMPRTNGHHFVFYGDSCSGVPGARHARNLARINAVVARLDPAPEFVVFPGDEVIGLTPDEAELRAQWRYFFDVEMAWLRDASIPVYHTTGNHTTYDEMSEAVFADVMAHLPQNGPAEQLGRSYVLRQGDLVLVFVNTLWSGYGGEGHVETAWLRDALREHGDATWKFVVGHHPAFPVNGYAGAYQRTIGDEYRADFWQLLTENDVTAYLCSHILAFDVQCHAGVLQITSAGAGTADRMPESVEYLHCVDMAVDDSGLRYQVIDGQGETRETLSWPPTVPAELSTMRPGRNLSPMAGQSGEDLMSRLWISASVSGERARQTLCAACDDAGVCPFWIGLVGRQRQLTIVMQPTPGRSPHRWLGPKFQDGETVSVEILLNGQMGPGGCLWRARGSETWTGFHGMSAWGLERLVWPETLFVGQQSDHDQDTRFHGDLTVSIAAERIRS